METVCHVRGEENYWLKNNPPFFFTSSQKEDVFYTILDIWNKNLKINYFTFRQKIRNIVISYLTGMFDVVLVDNKQCIEFFSTNKRVLLYQQDDDDIVYKIPTTNPGLNVFFYSHIDCINMRRGSKSKTRSSFYKNNKLRSIQSNHTFINNTNNDFDFREKKIWEKDHTFYDTLIENNSIPVHFTEQVITTQFYHLTSLSGLYNMIHNKKSLNVYNFKDFTTNYIKNLHYINNVHQLVDSFKKIYNSLI